MTVTLRDVENMLSMCAALSDNGVARGRFDLAAATVREARKLILEVTSAGGDVSAPALARVDTLVKMCGEG